jgi:hypothetical protein
LSDVCDDRALSNVELSPSLSPSLTLFVGVRSDSYEAPYLRFRLSDEAKLYLDIEKTKHPQMARTSPFDHSPAHYFLFS